MEVQELQLTAKDFKSDQEVRWCPGCGDHAVLNAVQKAMAELGIAREQFAVISGIGCSSRFPYYMNTYAFHSIHGRAGAIASGVKTANPSLCVWQITGDGDALAIGGNHFIHEIRRNIDLNLILFNNEIYGLTKGQYSPTTKEGKITKSSPFGTVESPFKPGQLVIGSSGKFFARTLDTNIKHTTQIMIEAATFRGTSVVEVLQNCVIYADKIHAEITDKQFKNERQLFLEHGKPMIFGDNNDKGIILRGMHLEVVEIGKDGVTEADLLVHDAKSENPFIQMMLVNMGLPNFPVAFGVIRAVESATYDQKVERQIRDVQATTKIKCMDDLLRSGSTWEV
ncbi:MAG: 2-oxoacid:ferredoxin oxidoreductase subunit beta [Bacteroidales bacterium]|nr:2-oxoacid:ferredoxin oxidoreductase subunit beta [Bacteroidales bacterium]MCF8456149.1 2-oxoacid:ferredoxin oxidoreductase subunit beta [Bacteroidales bacterium]